MPNVIEAALTFNYITLYDTAKLTLEPVNGNNRAQSQGAPLENFVRFLFENYMIESRYNHVGDSICYTGSANHPPDLMISLRHSGDAIEVKKFDGVGVNRIIPLNSSFPKNKLYINDSKITDTCRRCEQWDVRDMLYAIGHMAPRPEGKALQQLWLVYGDCWCDTPECYQNVSDVITNAITNSGHELAQTNELARVNSVGALNNVQLRVRGMWQIQHPAHLLAPEYYQNKSLVIIMSEEKYNSLPQESIRRLGTVPEILTQEISIQDPTNDQQHMNAVLITA